MAIELPLEFFRDTHISFLQLLIAYSLTSKTYNLLKISNSVSRRLHLSNSFGWMFAIPFVLRIAGVTP